ncbi:19S/PA700 proteasome regulatory particle subunit Rpn1p/S1, partial [Giardia duodenalis]
VNKFKKMSSNGGSEAAADQTTAPIDPHVVAEESLKLACDRLEKAVSTKREQAVAAAVDNLYNLFNDSNSPTTGVPIVLRYIEPYINSLIDYYEASRNKKLGSIALKLLLIYRVDSPDFLQLFGCIYYETHATALELWSVEFLCGAANYFAQFYGNYIYLRKEKGEALISDLCNCINNFHINCQTAYEILLSDVERLTQKNMESEAIDCLIEARLCTNVKALTTIINKGNIHGLAEYLYQCAVYGDPAQRNQIILALVQVYLSLDMVCDAFVLLLSLCFFSYAKSILYKTTLINRLLQMAYLIACNGCCCHFSRNDFRKALASSSSFAEDTDSLEKQTDELWLVACNAYTHTHLLSLVSELELNVPRSVAEILKADQLSFKAKHLDRLYGPLGDYLMNGFANAAMGTDKLLASHKIYRYKQRDVKGKPITTNEDIVVPAPTELDLPLHSDREDANAEGTGFNGLTSEGSTLLEHSISPITSIIQTVGAASVGLIYLYHGNGHGQAFNVISRYFSSPHHWVRAGAVLALGLSAANTQDPTGLDPALRMMGGVFNLFHVNPAESFSFHEYFPYSCNIIRKQLSELQSGSRPSQSSRGINSNSQTISEEGREEESVFANVQYMVSQRVSASHSRESDTRTRQQYMEDLKRIINNPHIEKAYSIIPHTNFPSPAISIDIKDEHEYLYMSQASAALGIGVAYAGTSNKLAIEILYQRLSLSSTNVCKHVPILEKNPRSTGCLALGLVLASTANMDAANFILRVMAGNTRNQRSLRFFPLKPVGLGCIFMRAGRTEEGQRRMKDFCDNMYDKLLQIDTPDSKQEHGPMPSPEEHLYLAAYVQSVITVCGYAFTGNISIISEIMQSIYETISGRVAAEETINLNKLGSATKPGSRSSSRPVDSPDDTSSNTSRSQGRTIARLPRSRSERSQSRYNADDQTRANNMAAYTADSGMPLQLPRDNTTLWPGENLDPVGILVAGLGLVAGNDPVCSMMVTRFINRIMQYGSSYAKRACPLALAVMNLSRPAPELTDMLFRMASQSDESLSINAIIALGLIGCGSCNSRIAQSLRQLADSKYLSMPHTDYGRELTNMIILAIKLSLGLVHCGRGLMHISVTHHHGKAISNSRLSCIAALILLLASNSRVMVRPKFINYFFLIAGALRPKYLVTVDAANKEQSNPLKTGSYIDTVSLPEPFRLTGYQTNTTPIILSHAERAVQSDENIVPMLSILEDVVVTTRTISVDMTID